MRRSVSTPSLSLSTTTLLRPTVKASASAPDIAAFSNFVGTATHASLSTTVDCMLRYEEMMPFPDVLMMSKDMVACMATPDDPSTLTTLTTSSTSTTSTHYNRTTLEWFVRMRKYRRSLETIKLKEPK